MISWYSRFLWADIPVSCPAPSWRGFEALLWEFNSASHIAELGVCQTRRTPVPHQGQFSLVLILWIKTTPLVAQKLKHTMLHKTQSTKFNQISENKC